MAKSCDICAERCVYTPAKYPVSIAGEMRYVCWKHREQLKDANDKQEDTDNDRRKTYF